MLCLPNIYHACSVASLLMLKRSPGRRACGQACRSPRAAGCWRYCGELEAVLILAFRRLVTE